MRFSRKSPDFLDQAVVELAVPLARQERLDGRAALQKLRAIAPTTVRRVGKRDTSRIACIPGVFGHTCLLGGRLGGEGGQRRAVHGIVLDDFGSLAAALLKSSGRQPASPASAPAFSGRQERVRVGSRLARSTKRNRTL
jgi:hypothetical protein